MYINLLWRLLTSDSSIIHHCMSCCLKIHLTTYLSGLPRKERLLSLHLSATFTPPVSDSFGLCFVMQTYPQAYALYVVCVPHTRVLPPTSFRFYLAMDTLVLS